MTTNHIDGSASGVPMQDITLVATKRRQRVTHLATRPTTVHSARTQHSTMLNRRYVKQPTNSATSLLAHASRRAKTTPSDHRTGGQLAPSLTGHIEPTTRPAPSPTNPIATWQTNQAPQPTDPQPTTPAITAALPRPSRGRRLMRWFGLAAIGMLIITAAGYITYLNMPHLSLRIASIQSGVDAKYPHYQPDGYSLRGPISFKEGQVSMQFADIAQHAMYTLTQLKTSWNSEAAKRHVFGEAAIVTTTAIDGLTIYSSGNQAAWVNAGVLYRVTSTQPMASEQLQKLATSL